MDETTKKNYIAMAAQLRAAAEKREFSLRYLSPGTPAYKKLAAETVELRQEAQSLEEAVFGEMQWEEVDTQGELF